MLLSPQADHSTVLGRGNLPSMTQHRPKHFSNVTSDHISTCGELISILALLDVKNAMKAT